jgi:hypothetical protein
LSALILPSTKTAHICKIPKLCKIGIRYVREKKEKPPTHLQLLPEFFFESRTLLLKSEYDIFGENIFLDRKGQKVRCSPPSTSAQNTDKQPCHSVNSDMASKGAIIRHPPLRGALCAVMYTVLSGRLILAQEVKLANHV